MSPASYRKPGEKGIIAHIKEYWFLYLFLGQLIYQFGYANFTLADVVTRITEVETTHQKQDVQYITIQTDLAAIKTSLRYIENNLKM